MNRSSNGQAAELRRWLSLGIECICFIFTLRFAGPGLLCITGFEASFCLFIAT